MEKKKKKPHKHKGTAEYQNIIENYTDKNITAQIKDSAFGIEAVNKSVVIEKGQIYEFDWMIDSVVISY